MSTAIAPVSLTAGEELPARTVGPITRTDIVRYAGAGGDFNPIHHDEEFARAAGMPSVFSMGLLQGGMLAQYLAARVGLRNVRRFAIRFTAQVWPGDQLELGGRVVSVDSGAAELELWARRANGETAIKGSATVAVAE